MAQATVASYVRFPAELYPVILKRAKEERRSVNSLVVEAVAKLLGIDEKSPGE